MEKCELCLVNEAEAYYKIVNSHPFSDKPTGMWLCYWCSRSLTENNVSLKRISPSFPAVKERRQND